ncbi:hypothetical protein AGMMS49545_17850 [Betaproteobacteria bacterium]|nr:hypothetical protein AGMMS49545_17850 [Betaproteobacteria bacterium]GHU44846.1 hypothetical protein AGMMS50289_14210 [Betaproteobacteria bacterium]
MNLRIDEDLREKFTAAAERNHRPAAQVLRDLMRDYVAQNDAVATFPRISEAVLEIGTKNAADSYMV